MVLKFPELSESFDAGKTQSILDALIPTEFKLGTNLFEFLRIAEFKSTEDFVDARKDVVTSGKKGPMQFGTRAGRQVPAAPVQLGRDGKPVPPVRSQYHQQQQAQQQQQSQMHWSIDPQEDWQLLKNYPLTQLSTMQFPVKSVSQDIAHVGELFEYESKNDKIIARTGGLTWKRPITEVLDPSTHQDPLLLQIESMTEEESVLVVGTSTLFSQMMCSSRSVHPFDIVIVKKTDENSGKVVLRLEKREDSEAASLAASADSTHQFDLQQLLTDKVSEILPMDSGYQWVDDDVTPPKVAFKYKTVKFADQFTAIVRTELSGVEKDKPILVRSLVETGPKFDWKTKLDMQRGAVITEEIKKSNNRVARFVAESVLAGCETMKLAFITKKGPTTAHSLLGVHSVKTSEIATQMGVTESNCWGIVKEIVNLIINEDKEHPNMQYLYIRDPTKTAMRLYRLPGDGFPELEADT
jgi:translation initiation factor 3 subunit D